MSLLSMLDFLSLTHLLEEKKNLVLPLPQSLCLFLTPPLFLSLSLYIYLYLSLSPSLSISPPSFGFSSVLICALLFILICLFVFYMYFWGVLFVIFFWCVSVCVCVCVYIQNGLATLSPSPSLTRSRYNIFQALPPTTYSLRTRGGIRNQTSLTSSSRRPPPRCPWPWIRLPLHIRWGRRRSSQSRWCRRWTRARSPYWRPRTWSCPLRQGYWIWSYRRSSGAHWWSTCISDCFVKWNERILDATEKGTLVILWMRLSGPKRGWRDF